MLVGSCNTPRSAGGGQRDADAWEGEERKMSRYLQSAPGPHPAPLPALGMFIRDFKSRIVGGHNAEGDARSGWRFLLELWGWQ